MNVSLSHPALLSLPTPYLYPTPYTRFKNLRGSGKMAETPIFSSGASTSLPVGVSEVGSELVLVQCTAKLGEARKRGLDTRQGKGFKWKGSDLH